MPLQHIRKSLPILLALMLATSSCDTVKEIARTMDPSKPTVSLASMDLVGLSLDGAELQFDLDVGNPYGVPLPVAGLDYALSSGGTSFLSGDTNWQGMIPAKGHQIIPLKAQVGFIETLRLLQSVRPGAIVPYVANLGVSVDAPGVGPLRLPVETSGQLPIPTVPTVNIKQVKWESLSLSDASAILGLEVGNGNSFSLDVDRLSYSLSLAGQPIATTSLQKALSVPSGGSGLLEIPISFRPMDLGTAALQMLSGREANWNLSGTMEALTPFGLLNLPVGGQGITKLLR